MCSGAVSAGKCMMNERCCKAALYCILAVYCLFVAARLFSNPDEYQWDFKLYYYASKAYAAGLDPYDSAVLQTMAKEPLNVYNPPPIALAFFGLFSRLDYTNAYYLFLAFKLAVLFGLIYLWRNGFLDKNAGVAFYVLCLFAFRSALYIDMRAGNVNMLVELLLWLAFLLYLKGGLSSFCLLVLLSSLYNLVTIFFLVPLLFVEHEKKRRYLCFSAIVFLGIMTMTYVRDPHVFKSFVRNAMSSLQDERGLHQPSTLPFVADVMKALFPRSAPAAIGWCARIVYLAVVAIVAAASWHAAGATRLFKNGDGGKLLIYLSCTVYALIHPRFKDYYYVLLILPTYFIMARARRVKAGIPLLALVILPSVLSRENPLPGAGRLAPMLDVFWEYYPLIIAYCVWGLYLYEIFAPGRGDVPCASSGGE